MTNRCNTFETTKTMKIRLNEIFRGTFWLNSPISEGFKNFMSVAKGSAIVTSWLISSTLGLYKSSFWGWYLLYQGVRSCHRLFSNLCFYHCTLDCSGVQKCVVSYMLNRRGRIISYTFCHVVMLG